MPPTPDARDIVVNTGPLIALAAGMGTFDVLRTYRRVVVPAAVRQT
jgi:hypothetical protein